MEEKEQKTIVDILADKIFDAVIAEHVRVGGMVIINRMISWDFARMFKQTSMDYTANCVLVERLYLRKDCTIQKKMVQKFPEEAERLRTELFKMAYDIVQPTISDEDREKMIAEAEEIEEKLKSYELIDAEIDMMTYSPTGLQNDNVVVIDLSSDSFSQMQYRSFCQQIALFVLNYFAAMIMVPPVTLNIDVIPVNGTTYLDIVCRLKSEER